MITVYESPAENESLASRRGLGLRWLAVGFRAECRILPSRSSLVRVYWASVELLILPVVFGLLLADTLGDLEGKLAPELNRLEKQGPA